MRVQVIEDQLGITAVVSEEASLQESIKSKAFFPTPRGMLEVARRKYPNFTKIQMEEYIRDKLRSVGEFDGCLNEDEALGAIKVFMDKGILPLI